MDTDKVFRLLVIDLFQCGFHSILQIVIRFLQRKQAFDHYVVKMDDENSEQLIGNNARCSLAAGDIAAVIDSGKGRSIWGRRRSDQSAVEECIRWCVAVSSNAGDATAYLKW